MSVRVLDSSVANLIAAGEVVERPASVVKELVENSIDAGARHISVEIEDGGKKKIRVTDDGCGMTPEDARLSFLKHATSKINGKEDLFSISTLGFRGEAIPSVAAVSHFSMLTKRADAQSGFCISLDGGVAVKEEEAPSADGTTVTVSDLFYNTPARLKFLKSDMAEAGAIKDYVMKLAVSRPEVSFTLSVNGQEQFFTAGNGNLDEAVYAVYGKAFLQELLPVDSTVAAVRVHGYTCKPIFSKANRRDQLFFVNGRYVRSRLLQTVLESCYKNILMISRYPYAVLFLEIPPTEMDINVHPSKLEVKFADESAVSSALTTAVQRALSFEKGIEQIRLPEEKPVPVLSHPVSRPEEDVKKPAEGKVVKETFSDWVVMTEVSEPPVQPREPVTTEKPAAPSVESVLASARQSLRQLSVAAENNRPAEVADCVVPQPFEPEKPAEQMMIATETAPITVEDFSIIGEAFDAYILVQKEDEILFIDKHALHERMNFERLKTEKIATQLLLTPVVLDFGKEDNALLLEHKSLLAQSGFDVDDFGTGVAVREIPILLKAYHTEKIFAEFIELLRAGKTSFNPLDEMLHSVACRASIKSGTETSAEEMKSLIARYFRDKDKLKYCPHGRPIAFSLSRNSIEKEFKRIV